MATKALQAKVTKEKQDLLITAVQDLKEKHKTEFEALAQTHLVTAEYLNKLILMPHFKTMWGVSLQNAKVHAKAMEVNAGVYSMSLASNMWFLMSTFIDLGIGECIKLSEI